MKKILLAYIPKRTSLSKFIFTALLLLLSIFNRQVSFAAGQNVISTRDTSQARQVPWHPVHGSNTHDEAFRFAGLQNENKIP